ncbi:SulP family sulfate permease [Mollisia scopiformis]|uniref:SulP family sulfate permease n=1 Tax=Mollisia scopiformis TaxID=149040 RepID=A0A194XHQ1_MOLSC|nr:SulP family sulfate permease [Mollisia scopiformis]KUJ19659.1 SulP family sulfate permease [Mollisia scopiformis]
MMKYTLSRENVLSELGKDENLRRVKQSVFHGASELPPAAGRYLLQKVPVVQWLPKYSPRWLINDLIAGLTVGVILVPQALAYAKIAGIPLQDGLLASWLPSALYFIMGTSKDINTGPTSIIGLLTAQIIKQVSVDGYTPTAIAVAIAFSVGIYCLVMGLLKLGFFLEFVSLPVLTGFISAAAITIILGQVPAIFGETVGTGVANQIHDIFAKLPTTKPITFAVGISGILLLCIMQYAGQRWGKQSKVVWIMSISRNAITILLFTIISFFVNKDIKTPIFDLTGKIPSGLIPPKSPDLALVGKVFQSSLAVFIAAALEHIAIAKSFGRKNHYTIDQSQELTFLGVINVLNSFFGGMAVGGAASRTAVNSESGVKSPLSGLFTSGAVLLSVYFLTGALFWIPKATLSAVIIVAVWQIVVPVSVFISYWKVSFADFVASQIAFWVTLFVSAEEGIETATAFMVAYTLLSTIFSKAQTVQKDTFAQHYPSSSNGDRVDELPAGTALVKISHPIIFLNASRAKSNILDAVQTYHSGAPSGFDSQSKNPDRLWNELGAQHTALLRRKAEIPVNEAEYLPRVTVLVLDLQGVMYLDMSGIQALKDMQTELKAYAGGDIEIRFAGLRENLVGKLQRGGWQLVEEHEASDSWSRERSVVLYGTVRDAILARERVPCGEKEEMRLEHENMV